MMIVNLLRSCPTSFFDEGMIFLASQLFLHLKNQQMDKLVSVMISPFPHKKNDHSL